MTIRTLEQLQDKLDEELAWRRKELTLIKSNIKSAKGKYVDTAIRAGVALLYAHWEGFIKNTSVHYLNFVAHQRHKYKNLAPNFIALKLKQKLTECEQSNKSSVHTQVVDFLLNELEQRANLPYDNVIYTQSNLSSSVFKEIVLTIGLDYTVYETKSKLIDEKLLKTRNEIAHGELSLMTIADFELLFNEITNLIVLYKNDVLNAGALKRYLKAV